MKYNRNQQEQSPSKSLQADSLAAHWLLQQVQPSPEAAALALNLSKTFEILEFQLGDDVAPSLSNQKGDSQQNSQDFYLICQGRVRLLSFDPDRQREASIQVIAEGDSFGGDALFCEVVLPYRAIAAGPVQVGRISIEKLRPWLEKLSELQENWSAAARQRQCAIFFKTLTELRGLSSYRLQQLLPYLVEKRIAAGESLALATPSGSGRYWLRRGRIRNQTLAAGSSWGYPQTVPGDWEAQTDLWAYQLSKQDWDAASAIAPVLAEAFGDIPPSEAVPAAFPEIPRGGRRLLKNPVQPLPSPIPPPAEPAPPPPQQHQGSAPALDFPKPYKRRLEFWRGYPFIEQQSAADCGPTCLAMISQYWGKRFSLNTLRNAAGVGRSGASLRSLAKAAERLGYQASPVRASLNRLVERGNPWIAHWEGDHYVVVYRTKGDRLLVADPAWGKRLLSRSEFLDSWTGYALLLTPTEQLAAAPDEKRSLGRFFGLLLPYRSLGFQIILTSLLIQIFGLVTPVFTQIILDQVVVNKSLTTLNVFAIGVLMFGVWGIALSSIRQYLLSYLANRLDLTMMSGFIRHALMLPLKFFELRHVGDILTRVNENEKIQRFLLNQVVLAWLDFLMGFIYLGLMLYYNWQLTLLVVALMPPILILIFGATPLLRRVSREVFNRSAEQNSALIETMTGIATVKATASEQELRWRWEERLTSFLNARFRGQKLGINLQAASGLINSVGSTALLWYGASLVIQDQLTIGQFVAFNMLIGKVFSPVLALANLWDELQEVLISVERLDDVFAAQPEETPGEPMLVLPPVRGEVRFENVTFRYDSDEERNTLQNISFEVEAGQSIAIVGRSGSGKTTLVKLLQALYSPESGHIWIDGHDIRHVSPQSLRSQLGVVPQECFLFSGTILDNIALYRPEFTLEQVIEVAKLAEANPFIQSMPLGYNTKVGERGTNLSGGQRQRIAIARALLGEPRILVLDEATSSLDTESERRFQQNLARLSRNRTTFIIAHRLSTVRNADCILVLDRGLLVERGTHEELMALKGLYYHLAQQQLDL